MEETIKDSKTHTYLG